MRGGVCKLLIADMKKCQHPVSGDESHYHFSWKEYCKFCCCEISCFSEYVSLDIPRAVLSFDLCLFYKG